MGLANAPTSQHDGIALFELVRAGTLDSPGKINPRDHREAANHRRLAGDCQPVLVVDCRMGHANGNLAVHQVSFIKFRIGSDSALLAFGRSVNADGFECGHGGAPEVAITLEGVFVYRPRLNPATVEAGYSKLEFGTNMKHLVFTRVFITCLAINQCISAEANKSCSASHCKRLVSPQVVDVFQKKLLRPNWRHRNRAFWDQCHWRERSASLRPAQPCPALAMPWLCRRPQRIRNTCDCSWRDSSFRATIAFCIRSVQMRWQKSV